jgi:hypothetical protein
VSDDTTFLKIASQWLIAIMLTLALIIFFLLVTAVQLTSESSGQRILRRGVAVTAGIDAALPRIESGLHTAALESEEADVRVPNFPVPIDIPREEAARIEGAQLRGLILDESARRLYDDGTSAWASNDEAAEQNIDDVSTAGALHRGFGLIRDTWHDIFLASSVLMGIICLLLAAMLMIALQSYMRIIALGAVTVAAAVPSLAAAVGVRFALRTAETGADPFERGLIDLGVDTVWILIRNYLILSILGFAVLGIASLALWLRSRASTAPGVPNLDGAS